MPDKFYCLADGLIALALVRDDIRFVMLASGHRVYGAKTAERLFEYTTECETAPGYRADLFLDLMCWN